MAERDQSSRLTIGLPVYNGARYLAGALESLAAQTYRDYRIVVSDNASTDSTSEIVREFAKRDPRVEYVRSAVNRGAAWNFNSVFHSCTSPYFKWAAHDDLYAPTFLEECIGVLDRNPSVGLCFTKTDFIDDDGKNLGEYPFPTDMQAATPRDIFRVYASGRHINCEIFGVFRTSALKGTPLIASYVGSDLVLLGRIALRAGFHEVPQRLFLHREHSGRSAHATADARAYTQWFDSRKSGRFALPYWRRIFENSHSIVGAPVPLRDKAACFLDIARTAKWNKHALLNDLRTAFKSLRPPRKR